MAKLFFAVAGMEIVNLYRRNKERNKQMDYKMSYNFKTRYYIEPSGPFGWVFRREGSDKVIKRARHRSLLLVFASDFIKTPNDEVCVCDENGMLVEVKKF